MPAARRLIVGITGATGIVYGVRLLELLRETGIETHLVVSRAADLTRAHELDLSAKELRALAAVHYPITEWVPPSPAARSAPWGWWWPPARPARWPRSRPA